MSKRIEGLQRDLAAKSEDVAEAAAAAATAIAAAAAASTPSAAADAAGSLVEVSSVAFSTLSYLAPTYEYSVEIGDFSLIVLFIMVEYFCRHVCFAAISPDKTPSVRCGIGFGVRVKI